MNAPFPIDPVLTGIAIAYKNEELVAERVLPTVPVAKQEFKYNVYDLGDTFRIPDTKVGRRGKPGEIEFGYTEASGMTNDEGLDDPIPQNDINNAAPGFDPVAHAVSRLTAAVALGREAAVAAKVFATANYLSAQRVTLSGSSQWSDPTSDPLSAMLTAMDLMIMRPNKIVMGGPVWTKLSQHPKLLKAYNRSTGDTGKIPLGFLQDLLEVREIVIGRAWRTTSKPGQTTATARVWGKHVAMLHIDENAQNGQMPTYGFTASWGGRIAGSQPDGSIGLRGGVRARSGESRAEIICAMDLGYLFTDAVA